MSMLLTIGEFSRMTHLSVKALRHYHDVGLLDPADVDPGSGYRLYTAAQVPTAQLIRRLRDLDMPLDEVRSVLDAPDAAARDKAIAVHLERMELRLQQTQMTVASLRSLLEGSALPGAVAFRTITATRALGVRDNVRWNDCAAWLGDAYNELYAALDAARVAPAGPGGCLYPEVFFEEEAGELVAFVPSAGELVPPRGTELLTVPATPAAVMLHEGSFNDIDRTYGALGTIVNERGIGVPGPIREYYLVSESDTGDESQHRTEVCWPVTANAARSAQ